MYFNEMDLKVHYEMKKEEMEKAILASKYSKYSGKETLYTKFFSALKNSKLQKKYLEATPNCCNIKIQEVCCEN
ncbi:hypothetical protein [Ferdinandcohnia sp. SAFN-114]|uniref:hypothetical protein n=1 Tax=Ferdinandcohnia sp. SAFN-114 TaxID=3387275 RepID=UPI003F810BD2